MKQNNYLLLVCAVLITGCSNNFDDIFNGKNEDVISPIELEGEDASAWAKMENSGWLEKLVPAALTELGISFPDNQNPMESELDMNEAHAVIAIDGQSLKDVYGLDAVKYSWPDIDFDKYSVVLGWFRAPSSGYRIVNQRLQTKKDKNILYLEIKPSTGIVISVVSIEYFASIYPKQEGNTVEIYRWNNY